MDDRRFDALARTFASSGSRRQVLRAFLGLGAAAAAGASPDKANAARRPAPTPTPVKCPGAQVWSGGQCICTSGDKCGPDCCGAGSQCCDNACCDGICYGEELCCPLENWCPDTGQCCEADESCCGAVGCIAPGKVECCSSADCGVNATCNPDNVCVCDGGYTPNESGECVPVCVGQQDECGDPNTACCVPAETGSITCSPTANSSVAGEPRCCVTPQSYCWHPEDCCDGFDCVDSQGEVCDAGYPNCLGTCCTHVVGAECYFPGLDCCFPLVCVNAEPGLPGTCQQVG